MKEDLPIRTSIFCLGIAILAFGCAERHVSILDEELSLYRSEQERFRREELEEIYLEEQARSDELTDQILELRAEIEEKTRKLGELHAQRAELDAQLEKAPPGNAGGTPAPSEKQPPKSPELPK